jgi:hypothetical protein
MADWSNPQLTSTYTNFVTEVKNRDVDLALQFDGTTSTNLTTGTIRWSSSANRWQKWNGSAWAELTGTYALTGLSTTGAASIGTTLGVTGATTLSGGGTSTTAAIDNNSTNIATTAYVVGQASGTAPVMNGTATIGTSLRYSRQDHVHPSDTSRAPLASPTFTGTVTIPAGASISGYAPLASPTFSGTPAAPTATAGTNTTQIASTAFVSTAIAGITGYAPLVSPAFTGTPTAPTAAIGTNTTQLATTAFVAANALPFSGGTMTGVITYAAAQPRLVSGNSIASTSGTSIDFTGIPSWVKRVTVMFNGVSTNGSSTYQLQVGSGSVVTTGYASTSSAGTGGVTTTTATTGHLVATQIAAAALCNGHCVLTNVSGNIWVGSSLLLSTGGAGFAIGASNIALSGTLDRVRITTVNGTDTFDAGTINIFYEG